MTIIKHRRGTAAEWTASNRVLAYGELGIEYDTYRLKIGDGTKTWSELPYALNDLTIEDAAELRQAAQDAQAAAATAEAAAAQAVYVSEIEVSDQLVHDLMLNVNGIGPLTSEAFNEAVRNLTETKTDVYIRATEPTEATEGDFWVNGKTIKVRTNGAWTRVGGDQDTQHLTDSEQNLRLWQLEAEVIGISENSISWVGEGFLEGQDNVESSNVKLSRSADLDLGHASFAAYANAYDFHSLMPPDLAASVVRYLGGRFIVVYPAGPASGIFTSEDGVRWTQRFTPTTAALRGVAYANGRYIVVGDSGTVLISDDDAVTWRAVTVSGWGASSINGVAYGSGIWVLSGPLGRTTYSTDNGETWAAYVSHGTANFTWSYVGYHAPAGRFVMVGGNSYLASSPDGINWTVTTTGSTGARSFNADGPLALFGDAWGAINTSADGGQTWTSRTSQITASINSIAWTGTHYVAVADGGSVSRSTDGINWVKTSLPSTQPGYVVAHGNDVTVVFGGVPFRSLDHGATWEYAYVPYTGSGTPAINTAISANGRLVIGGDASVIGSIAYSDDDGRTWTKATVPSALPVVQIAWNGSVFVAAPESNVVWTSPDGATWTAQTIPNFYSASVMRDVTWDGSRFIVAVYPSAGNYPIAWSPDGITWTAYNQGGGQERVAAATNGTRHVVIGGLSNVLTTDDLASGTPTWTSRSVSPAFAFTPYAIVWAGDRFVVAGDSGMVYTSPDGATWTASAKPSTSLIRSLVYTPGGMLFAIGAYEIWYSEDNGVTWDFYRKMTTSASNGQTYVRNVRATLDEENERILIGSTSYATTIPFAKGEGYVILRAQELPAPANSVYLLSEDDGNVIYEATLDGATWVPVTSGQTTELGHSGTQFSLRATSPILPSPSNTQIRWFIAYAKEA